MSIQTKDLTIGTEFNIKRTYKYNRIFKYEEWKDFNLVDLTIQNFNGQSIFLNEQQTDIFIVHQNGLSKMDTHFSLSEAEILIKLLETKQIVYQTRWYHAGYFKNQPNPLISLGIDIDHWKFKTKPEIKLLEFGASYGKLSVNDIEVAITHGGGTFRYKDAILSELFQAVPTGKATDVEYSEEPSSIKELIKNVTWADSTSSLSLCGKCRIKVFKSLIDMM